MPRMIFHNLPSNITIGVDIGSTGDIYASLAACHPRDFPKLTRRIAYSIVNGRLNNTDTPDRIFIGNYTGKSITKDVYGPIRDTIREMTPKRSVTHVMGKLKEAMLKMAFASVGGKTTDAVAPIDFKSECCSGESCLA